MFKVLMLMQFMMLMMKQMMGIMTMMMRRMMMVMSGDDNDYLMTCYKLLHATYQVTRTDEDAAREMEELTGAEAGVNEFVLHMAAR